MESTPTTFDMRIVTTWKLGLQEQDVRFCTRYSSQMQCVYSQLCRYVSVLFIKNALTFAHFLHFTSMSLHGSLFVHVSFWIMSA